LTSVFDEKVAKKKHVRDQHATENIHSYKLEQDMKKAEAPIIMATAAKTIFELDVLTH